MNDIRNPADYPTYQPGDQVTIRQWDDMAAEFGLNEYGEIKIPKIFSKVMKKFCGQTFTIKDVRRKTPPYFDTYILEDSGFLFSAPMFEQSKFQSVPPSSLSFDDLLQGGD